MFILHRDQWVGYPMQSSTIPPYISNNCSSLMILCANRERSALLWLSWLSPGWCYRVISADVLVNLKTKFEYIITDSNVKIPFQTTVEDYPRSSSTILLHIAYICPSSMSLCEQSYWFYWTWPTLGCSYPITSTDGLVNSRIKFNFKCIDVIEKCISTVWVVHLNPSVWFCHLRRRPLLCISLA